MKKTIIEKIKMTIKSLETQIEKVQEEITETEFFQNLDEGIEAQEILSILDELERLKINTEISLEQIVDTEYFYQEKREIFARINSWHEK